MARHAVDILLLDDSTAVRTRVAELLNALPGVHVSAQAGSLAAGMRCLTTQHPDLVIADLKLPDGTGLQVARAARRLHPRPNVVIFTNYDAPEFRDAGREAGADWFLAKRSGFEPLAEIVTAIARRHRRASRPARRSAPRARP